MLHLQVAIGFTPNSLAFSSDITMIAAAPSLILEAFPAVTIPSFLNAGFNFPIPSAVVPGLGPSSVSTMISPFLPLITTGTISSLNFPLLELLLLFVGYQQQIYLTLHELIPIDHKYFQL